MSKYDVAAYIWPAFTGADLRARLFWEEGIGEWQSIKNTKNGPGGYVWDRKPLWGYVNEADPSVMSMQIDAAVEHGVNVFIYDWYWYDNRPFLENCLNDGFLKAPNNHKMKFYIMWANHDAPYTWDYRNSHMRDKDLIEYPIWRGSVNLEQFRTIGRRWIENYFVKENYYKIDDKPVVSIYELGTFVKGLGGIEQAAEALDWLRREAKKAGFPGVHVQLIHWGRETENENLSGVDGGHMKASPEVIEKMGFDSLTNYQFSHLVNVNREYSDIVADVQKKWDNFCSDFSIPFYPHVSLGWDNNPRIERFVEYYTRNNTPAEVEKALVLAKEFADKTNVKLITINSWNEWSETSYLEPDNVNGYGYLEAVKKVFL